ncbi:peptide chain release factor 2 [soil metagenome]
MFSERLTKLAQTLNLQEKEARLGVLRNEVQAPGLWDNQEQAVALTAELATLEGELSAWKDLTELAAMSSELSENELGEISRDITALEQRALLASPHDAANAILTIHAGTGGTDAQDWAQMLLRMFLRFVEQGSTEQGEDRVLSLQRKGWKAELLEESRGEEAGIKKASLLITGPHAYGLLQSEAGVHRLVRQSPFNAKGLRQTSFALVEVIPQVEQQSGATINETELKVDVFRSGGAGGQHVNTTDSAVRLTHLPTGIVVSVQNERSQQQNKATAMKILQAKLSRLQELKNAEEIAMLKGEVKEGSWGNQIRSYVLHPYQLVKDHRTDAETSSTADVLDGDLKLFIEAYLTHTNQSAT